MLYRGCIILPCILVRNLFHYELKYKNFYLLWIAIFGITIYSLYVEYNAIRKF